MFPCPESNFLLCKVDLETFLARYHIKCSANKLFKKYKLMEKSMQQYIKFTHKIPTLYLYDHLNMITNFTFLMKLKEIPNFQPTIGLANYTVTHRCACRSPGNLMKRCLPTRLYF
jgi:hypothetical protein